MEKLSDLVDVNHLLPEALRMPGVVLLSTTDTVNAVLVEIDQVFIWSVREYSENPDQRIAGLRRNLWVCTQIKWPLLDRLLTLQEKAHQAFLDARVSAYPDHPEQDDELRLIRRTYIEKMRRNTHSLRGRMWDCYNKHLAPGVHPSAEIAMAELAKDLKIIFEETRRNNEEASAKYLERRKLAAPGDLFFAALRAVEDPAKNGQG